MMNILSDRVLNTGYDLGDIHTFGEIVVTEDTGPVDEVHKWISSRDAMVIFKLTSTQGAWNVIQRCERRHKFVVRRRNIGSEDYPRWLLNRDDVMEVARLMGKLDK